MRRFKAGSTAIFDPDGSEVFDVMGPSVQFVTSPRAGEPCVMRGIIPPGAVIPMHSHPDPETFVQLSGGVDALATSSNGFAWVKLGAGSVFHVPGNIRHAFRNPYAEPSIGIIATTTRLGKFFEEIGRPIKPGASTSIKPPAEETLRRFLDTADRYGHWIATPEDNAAVGITLPNI